ncbi:carbohydrate-binding domain-containing protein [Streptococcus suis]|nr:carbohydrate-binding domain-containing protein [Streptococcus suis]MBM7269769.1 carbohydrate-binding domain-containing protein [Streptococcus suis]
MNLVASDDAINAANASAYAGISLTIDGGELTVQAGGDGLDSNGNLLINDGQIFVSGALNPGNGALDYEGHAAITGGDAIIVGWSGMAQGFGSDSSQASLLVKELNGTVGSNIRVLDSEGNQLAAYTASQAFS